MRRVITQIGQSIYEWLFTRQAQDNMVALAKLSAAVLGTSTQFNGLAVSPTSPASMQVSVAPGEIYMLAALEGTIYGTLAADTTHQIVKQGISLDASLLTLTAPSVAGQSINYLIQATFQETDISVDPTSGTSPVVLQFYNDSNPTVPYSGPNNSGATSNTFRQGSVVLSAKAGISATTGSQVTPSPDSGYVGIAVVTVANGQTTITSGNITAYASAPSINSTLLGSSPVFNVPVQVGAATSALQAAQFGQVSGVVGQSRNAKMPILTASATATFTADELIVETALGGLRYCLPSLNQTINLATDMDTGSAPANGTVAVYMMYNPTANTKKLLGFNATTVTPGQVYNGSNAPAGYTASSLVAILQTNGSGQFKPAYVSGRKVSHSSLSVLNTSSSASSGTSLDISSVVPKGAISVSGYVVTSNSTTGDATNTVSLGADSAMNGAKTIQQKMTSASGWSGALSFENLSLSVSQTLFYSASANAGSPNYQISLSIYEF
nr:MAG TPA: hypothetical protein [Herelleviridae sp.]